MAQWKFQLCPNEKNVIGIGFRMDGVGEEVENTINDALRYPFKFHGVNKIVVRLGPSPLETPDYIEMLGVGSKQIPDFSAEKYVVLTEEKRREQLFVIVHSVFSWFLENFEDADFVRVAQRNLGWEAEADRIG